MALDEALLESAQQDGIATVRFYAWRQPTLSLGYFQPHADRKLHPTSEKCPMVRRASGGGAILHDRELTYSIALPHGHALAQRAERLYDAAHESLIETLEELGVRATRFCGQRERGAKAFLCFQRREPGDVLAGQHKIAGSAQRRQRGAVLQHGSVLLGRSQCAPELPGIAELFSGEVNIDELRGRWLPRLASGLECKFEEEAVPAALRVAAAEIALSKFGNRDWTCRR